jgi:general secretion pathway protein G
LVRNLTNTADSARIDQARIAMANISQQLQLYKIHNNHYPNTSQGLNALISNPGDSPRWRGPYLEKDKLSDPWGTPFDYKSDGRNYEIISAGPDQQLGSADDISYPPKDDEGGGGGAPAGGDAGGASE